MFTWIAIHREAIHRILEYRQNERELLTLLGEMEHQGLKVISLQDEAADGENIPLAEIDPFTFLASFNRGVTDDNRRKNWNFLKARWGLEAAVPDDFSGIPVLHPINCRLFPYAATRGKDHVPCLWQVASLAADGDIKGVSEELFDGCLKLKCVGIGSLTIGLFWINPENFLPADSKTRAYGKAKGITTEPEDYQSYRQWMTEMTGRLAEGHPQISYAADLFAVKRKSLNFKKWMGPLLDALRTLGGSGAPRDVADKIRQELKFPESVVTGTTKSGQLRFQNQVAWARKYLVWEGFVSCIKGSWQHEFLAISGARPLSRRTA